jgi:acetylornithine deacetylase/succinyl-diaminopimelate desuccinylase-like protein
MTLSGPELTVLNRVTSVPQVLDAARRFHRRVLDLTTTIARIPAPTHDEGERADFVEAAFREVGLAEVRRDEIDNVVGRVQGRNPDAPPLLLAAHLDTVFSRETPLVVEETADRLSGPGIGDNSLSVAALIVLPELLADLGVESGVDLLLTGNVGEEGLGNLVGIRRVMDDYPAIGAMVAIEGHNLGRVTHVAVGSVRLRVTVTGPGGHSWGDFGNPNAIHAAAEMIANLDRIVLPQSPKTTLSVGRIAGGISVNTIAPEVTFDLDMRSTDPAALDRLTERVMAALRSRDERVQVTIEVLGERPAGYLSVQSRIVRTGIEILRLLGYNASADASSTDANLAIHRELPAICIGLTTGGNVHTTAEYIDTRPVVAGIAQLVLLTLSLADELAQNSLR